MIHNLSVLLDQQYSFDYQNINAYYYVKIFIPLMRKQTKFYMVQPLRFVLKLQRIVAFIGHDNRDMTLKRKGHYF